MKSSRRELRQVPKYHRWFIPCVKKWLQQFQGMALKFVHTAWEDDKVISEVAIYEVLVAVVNSSILVCSI